ncbi:MAG: prepilin-type N-terminal cleavage/methylation domain-containing protein [Deltaproteobacteria bacterium]|nr:prepilin-type N-terminal cleavage/methylation domain-containing protein [Deltaproteobacteria bacterium]
MSEMRSFSGFSLIEMMVVVVITGVMVAMGVDRPLSRAIQPKT